MPEFAKQARRLLFREGLNLQKRHMPFLYTGTYLVSVSFYTDIYDFLRLSLRSKEPDPRGALGTRLPPDSPQTICRSFNLSR